ncbi:MAG TPA: prenyltransferase/squalene oxidase repeat-containing protein [Sphingobacteriaceae bacterium]|nr:prenyltransferase/squalene oxidase repeat-containing protein [Sphingobacteriaceae bacterium]
MRKTCWSLILLINLSASSVFSQSRWKVELLNYINTKLAKPDGGFGWEDQYDSHTSPTFAVTGVLKSINELPSNKLQLAEFIRTHHPQQGPNKEAGPSGSDLRNLKYEQIQAILWLGGDVSSFRDDVKSWKSQAGLLANYEGHKYAGLFQETMTPISSKLVGVEMENPQGFATYLESCRRANGSFNNAPTIAGGDGNILNTYWSLYAQSTLAVPGKLKPQTISWLNACQLKNGGFTHQPNPQIGVNDDASYTWAAIKSLKLLGAKPAKLQAAINYLTSLRNTDGGFGSRPGLHSTPMATYYAIDALVSLNALSELDKAPKPRAIVEPAANFAGYKIYTIQFQAQGSGSPQEAVMLADSLKIHLWGVKYPVAGWITEAQRIADERKVPVTFFMSNEPHNNELIISGMGSFNHVLDYFGPPEPPIHFADSSTFDELKSTTLKQLKDVNGGLMLQVSNNEPLARLLLDESINNFGYKAISTVHFGQNFMFWLPYIVEYRYRLPLVTLQDAHGKESWWWADELANHRTLFLAKEPTYNAMVTALSNNWIVGVRHDSLTNFKTRMFGGTNATRKFLSNNESRWKWWSAQNITNRPQAAISILSSADIFEAGKPEIGLNIRVRTRWNSVRETLKAAAVELVELKVDGKRVDVESVQTKGRRDIVDSYYLYKWGNPSAETHKIEALVKDVKTNVTYQYSQTFVKK